MKIYSLVFILLMACIGCSALPKSKTRTIRITVIDKNSNMPVDSAQVNMQTTINDLDFRTAVKYTDKSGKCRISIEKNPALSGMIAACKKGLIGYFDGRFVDLDRSFAKIKTTTKELTLYLTSDPMNHSNYWKQKAPKYDIDTLIFMLKANKFPDRSNLPLLSWEDIPHLLTIGNSTILINHYPICLISSSSQQDTFLGVVVLWFIESIRISQQSKSYDPLEAFPSWEPVIFNKNPLDDVSITGAMGIAYNAYLTWWQKAQNMDRDEACKINPLGNTNLTWGQRFRMKSEE